jgi:RNA polymerase sigma factor (sigma-70 family)
MSDAVNRVDALSGAHSEPPDPDRLEQLFRTEAPRLHRYFRQKTGDGETASDLVQDAFLKLVAVSTRRLSNPAAYLQRIARNMVFDRFRRAAQSEVGNELSLEDHDIAISPSQDHDMAARDLLRLYEEAVSSMSEKTRTVFLLSRAQGLTYEEIRQKLGISMGTVEYHMMRAIAHLARSLEDR